MFMLSLVGLGLVSLVELIIYFGFLKKVRKVVAVALIIAIAVFNGLLLGSFFAFWTVLILILSGYRVFNLLRLFENRGNYSQLVINTQETSTILILLQLIIVVLVEASRYYFISNVEWLYLISIVNLIILFSILFFTINNFKKALTKKSEKINDKDLPSVSICIPARNETFDLEECLKRLVMSDYKKLEILVLDDCSQNKRTSEIIKQYAYEGVRFISGNEPPSKWTAKNFAYEQLRSEASGEVLLYCGVDTRFSKNTVSSLLNILIKNKKSMLSIMPVNEYSYQTKKLSLLFQPVRYAWEVALPRFWFNRPPVLSTCWLIKKTALSRAGGFKAATHSILPESYLAKRLNKLGEYKFLASNKDIDLRCAKNTTDQYETAIRMRYPQVHRRPEIVALLSLSELNLFIAPFYISLYSILVHQYTLIYIAIFCCSLNLIIYSLLTSITYRREILLSLLFMPLAAIFDVLVINYSMWLYEFKSVIWKGRNICYPIMKMKISPQIRNVN